MIDSNNIEIIRDNLKELDQKIETLDVEIPPHTAGDVGKYLGVDASGDLEFSNPLPAHPSTDAGKYLGVDLSGDLEFSNPLPDTTSATAGQILALDSNKAPTWTDNYNLNFSTDEIETGMKWIDGRSIYRKSFSFTTLTSGSLTIGNIGVFDFITHMEGCIIGITNNVIYDRSEVAGFTITVSKDNGNVNVGTPSSVSYQEAPAIAWVEYIKPTPEPEPETKKRKSK